MGRTETITPSFLIIIGGVEVLKKDKAIAKKLDLSGGNIYLTNNTEKIMLTSITPILLIIYLTIAVVFAIGYSHTTFSKRRFKKIILSLLWFPFWIASPRYRRNFRRALKRSNDPW